MNIFRRLSAAASHVVGTGVSTASATLAMGGTPLGAPAVGGTAGTAAAVREVWDTGADVLTRALSAAEFDRIAIMADHAADRYDELVARGFSLREDNFFVKQPSGHNPGKELVEGVLITASRTYEERKLKHIGYMLANIGTDPGVPSHVANQAISMAESLTWQKYVILAGLGRKDGMYVPEISIESGANGWAQWSVLHDTSVLHADHFMTGTRRQTERIKLSLENMEMNAQRLVGAGVLLYNLLQLELVPNHEIVTLWELLKPSASD